MYSRTLITKVRINEISINGKFGIIRNLVSCLLNFVEDKIGKQWIKAEQNYYILIQKNVISVLY